MYTAVRLQNYRSYSDFSVELGPNVSIVVGPNASGKTNLLEALYVVSTGSSFRAHDDALIRRKQDWARVDATTHEDNTRSLKIERGESGTTQKSLTLDGASKKRFMPQHRQPVTLFEPEHLRFLVGSPELRRVYLDDVIAQSNHLMNNNLRQYKRALLQRNRLLKKQPTGWKDQLFVWDLKLSDFGSQIVEARKQLIEEINNNASRIYSDLSQTKAKLELSYESSVTDDDYRSASLDLLQSRLDKDLLRGSTSVGPHRDDVATTLNGVIASTSASRGEARTIVLTLKIIELEQLKQKTGKSPLMLLDDVFSELDGARRRALTSYLTDYQTVITTTDADAIVKHFLEDHTIIATE